MKVLFNMTTNQLKCLFKEGCDTPARKRSDEIQVCDKHFKEGLDKILKAIDELKETENG